MRVELLPRTERVDRKLRASMRGEGNSSGSLYTKLNGDTVNGEVGESRR
jgi:hypothetical protein